MISVQPISKKAKNRLANAMRGCNQCNILQHKGDRMLLASVADPENIFWVDLPKDTHWLLKM
jgi:hypothetical protein